MDVIEQDPDALAMRRLQAGEDLALNEIMARWKQPLCNYLLRQIGHREDALDIAQETFVRVYESRHRYEPTARFARWLFTIATNLCRNHFRWRQRHPEVTIESEDDEAESSPLHNVLTDGKPSASAQMEAKERAEALRKAVQALPYDLRTALLLFEYEGMAYAEIARITGSSVKAVESRLTRARQAIKSALKPWL